MPSYPRAYRAELSRSSAALRQRQNGQRLNAHAVAATGFCCPCDVTAV